MMVVVVVHAQAIAERAAVNYGAVLLSSELATDTSTGKITGRSARYFASLPAPLQDRQPIQLLRGIAELANSDLDTALALFRRAIGSNRNLRDPRIAYFFLARILELQGDVLSAENYWRLAQADRYLVWSATHAIGDMTMQERKRRLELAIEVAPGKEDNYRYLGEFLLAQGDTQGAIAAYEEGVHMLPTSMDLSWRLAELYLRLNKLDQAERLLLDITESSTSTSILRALAHAELGSLYEQKGDMLLAISHFANAVRNNPAELHYTRLLGHAYVGANRLDLAILEFNKLLLAPNPIWQAAGYAGLARVNGHLGRWHDAIQYLIEANQLAPGQGYDYQLALAWEAAGRSWESEALYVQASDAYRHALLILDGLPPSESKASLRLTLFAALARLKSGLKSEGDMNRP